MKFGKNGVAGNQINSPADSTAVVVLDTTHTDHVAAGDTFSLIPAYSGSAPTVWWTRCLFTADSGHANWFGGAFDTASGTVFAQFGRAPLAGAASEANAKYLVRTACTLTNAVIHVAQASTGALTITSRKNGAAGNISIAVTANATGDFEDTVNTDSLASGDTFGFQITGFAGSNIASLFCALSYSTRQHEVVSRPSVAAANFPFNAATTFAGILADGTQQTTESNVNLQHGFAGTAKNMRCFLSANSYVSDVTLVLRINGVNGNQTKTIIHAVTGTFEDTTNSDSFAATDAVNYAISGGTSGSMTVEWFMMTEAPLPTMVAPARRMFIPARH